MESTLCVFIGTLLFLLLIGNQGCGLVSVAPPASGSIPSTQEVFRSQHTGSVPFPAHRKCPADVGLVSPNFLLSLPSAVATGEMLGRQASLCDTLAKIQTQLWLQRTQENGSSAKAVCLSHAV